MKILITILLALFISSNAYARVKVLSKSSESSSLPYAVRTVCIDGYKWVHTARIVEAQYIQAMATTMNQFMIEKDGRAVPAKC
jgi:hypothetical protein